MTASADRLTVARALAELSVTDVMGYVAEVSRFDRYQASRGIEQAAQVVVEAAREIGLHDAHIRRYTADGTRAWWSFQAPLSWTPVAGRLASQPDAEDALVTDHAVAPFSLATYSASTPAGGVAARLVDAPAFHDAASLAGCMVVLDGARFADPATLQILSARGALGFVTDAPAARVDDIEHPGRIELPAGGDLVGFSVTPSVFATLRRHAAEGATAHVEVQIDTTAQMPVVTATLPGSAGEIWLIAHLCHPRPGANDNASGVAALLGAAQVLINEHRAGRQPGRTIRFIWGPEFVGPAAFLADQLGNSAAPPSAVVAMDMVGQDQAAHGGPFVVEHGPRQLGDWVARLAERVMADVFEATSGDPGSWLPAPFLARSDHAIFSSGPAPAPSVLLCHTVDPFNHSAGDSLDKVSPAEMVRATAAGAVLADALSREPDDIPLPAHADQLVAPRAGAPQGCWNGPLNIRALLEDAPASAAATGHALIAANKRHYSLLFHLALRCDGRTTREEIIADTATELGDFDTDVAHQLFDVLIASTWVREVPESGG